MFVVSTPRTGSTRPVSVRSSTLPPPLFLPRDTSNLLLPRSALSYRFSSHICSPSLLQTDEKRRSVASLSRAEDLQGKVDRMAVEKTLDGVAGGTVSALALIDRFAGTLYRQSRRVKVCSVPVRELVKRSTAVSGSFVRGGVLVSSPSPPSVNELLQIRECHRHVVCLTVLASSLTPVLAPTGAGGPPPERSGHKSLATGSTVDRFTPPDLDDTCMQLR